MGAETSKGPMQSVGHYDLLQKIAEGGMGTIYRGRDRRDGRIVAVKIMPPHMAANPVLLKRFEQEFKAAKKLDHPNIVRALDFDDTASSPYLVMEFVEGESLGQQLERKGAMAESDAIKVIAQVAQGLHRAHKIGLIHRDVKPDNVLVSTDGVAKLADLGLVKEAETDLNLTKTGRGLGTPHFMAPEQFRNAKNVDVRCDIYSLGATLYMMVTGELPFKSSGPLDAWMKKIQNDLRPPRDIVPALSERVNWAILRAMSADADQRPNSCREFIEDLTGHSTKRVPAEGGSAPAQSELWYLVYKDDEGATHTVKGSGQAIRRSLRDGLLGDAANIRCSRAKAGPFDPLRDFPQFRDLLVTAAALPVPGATLPNTEVPDLPRASARDLGAVAAGTAGRDLRAAPPATPHISLESAGEEGGGGGISWGTWAILLGIAFASATVAYFLVPRR
jgi:eukaryotic-like serine/threonine-protein kinase